MAFTPNNFNWAALAGLASGNTVGDQLGNANNVMANQAIQSQALQSDNATRNWLAKEFPNEDFSQLNGPALQQAFATGLQRYSLAQQPKTAEFKTLPDGTYGAWDGQRFNVLGQSQKPADLPAVAEEFNYARQQGFKGSFQDYQAYKAGLNKSGFMVEDTPDGMRVYQGDMSSAPGKMTEGNSKDVNWLYRGLGSNKKLDELDTKLTSLGDNTASRLGTPGNYLKSEDYQQAEQAGREFLAVVLRKDTGAAVTEAEMDLYGPMYLPQPGDKPPVIKQKAEARKRFMEGLGLGIPERMRKTVPGADTLFPDPNAMTTPDPTTTAPKQIILNDGTQGTIRRTK